MRAASNQIQINSKSDPKGLGSFFFFTVGAGNRDKIQLGKYAALGIDLAPTPNL